MPWTDRFASPNTRSELARLPVRRVAKGTVLFRPGATAEAFVVLVSGRIEVHLTGPTGREILLYAVEPGETCIQTTLGLLGDDLYSGEAVLATDARLVLIPRGVFLRLIDDDADFRRFVLHAFAQRMHDVTRLLERVAFGRVEARLARTLLDLAQDGRVEATQADLAARIGSAREVVTRRLDAWARAGLVATDRGRVDLLDTEALRQLAAGDA
jgi:CRP/FNR family transcriptional regulator